MKLLISLLLAVSLTGCAGFNADPIVEVVGNALDEPTIKSGMTSRDAAYMASYRRYIDKTTADKPIVSIEGTGGEIKISGVKSITVYAPSGAQARAPEKDKPVITSILDSVTHFAERALLPWYIVKEQTQITRESRGYEFDEERIRSNERRDVTSQAIEAASKDPLVITAP